MFEVRKQYAIYEKEPAHGSTPNGVIMGPYDTEEEAKLNQKKYGYDNDNYYIDTLNKEEAKDALIQLYESQIMDLSLMSKIELGDDVIDAIRKLKEIIRGI
jgi:hypothetical protein